MKAMDSSFLFFSGTLPSNMKKTVATGVVPDEMKIAYPAPTVGRKGALELRAAVQGLGIR